MTPYETGFLMGAAAGIVLTFALSLAYTWWESRPEKVDIDPSIERLRNL